jgi:hypothetical protein
MRVVAMRAEKLEYETPEITDYGSIAEHTFLTPGHPKGCTVDCHTDKWMENSANTVGSP